MGDDFWHTVFADNPVWIWFLALGVFIGVLGLLRVARWLFAKWLDKLYYRTQRRGFLLGEKLVRRTSSLFLFSLALFASSTLLSLPLQVVAAIRTFVLLAFLIQLGLWGTTALVFWVEKEYRKKLAEKDAEAATAIHGLSVLGKIAIWVLVFLLALHNLGVNVTALLTGLGLVGLAISLALQNVLSDFLSFIAIELDNPFLIGDFIVVGEHRGTVEKIGLKTTRIRSLTGEEIVFSNSELLRSRIQNFKKMKERRVTFAFGVVYNTPPELLERIPKVVQEIIESQPHTRFDRAHFKEFGNFSLIFEVVYFVLVPDYRTYMDTQEKINLELMRRLKEMGVQFAYPTQVVILERGKGGA